MSAWRSFTFKMECCLTCHVCVKQKLQPASGGTSECSLLMPIWALPLCGLLYLSKYLRFFLASYVIGALPCCTSTTFFNPGIKYSTVTFWPPTWCLDNEGAIATTQNWISCFFIYLVFCFLYTSMKSAHFNLQYV